MGVAASRPSSPASSQFKRRVLLIRAPPQVTNTFIHEHGENAVIEENFSSATTVLLRSVDCVTVSWTGRRLRPEQWLSVLGNHLVVIFFFTPEADREEGKDADQVLLDMKHAISEALDASPRATVLTIYPGIQEPVGPTIVEYDVTEREEDEAKPAGPIDYTALAKRAGYRFLAVSDTDKKKMFDVECHIASFLLPMDLLRPLSALLYELQENCDATEAHVLDAETLLPLASADDVHVDKQLSAPLYSMCFHLRNRLENISKSASNGDTPRPDFLSMSGQMGEVYLGWAVRPWAFVLLIRNRKRAACGELNPGEGMVVKNFDRISRHFSHVVGSTNAQKKYKPLAR